MAAKAPARVTFTDTLRHGWRRTGPAASPANGRRGKSGTNGNAPAGRTVGQAEILAKREVLAKRLAELQWDLGGLTYEMARRDHYRLDVLNKVAADLQKVDAELGQVERLLKMEQTGAAGECPSCHALAAHGAVFCWQCGHELTPGTGATSA